MPKAKSEGRWNVQRKNRRYGWHYEAVYRDGKAVLFTASLGYLRLSTTRWPSRSYSSARSRAPSGSCSLHTPPYQCCRRRSTEVATAAVPRSAVR